MFCKMRQETHACATPSTELILFPLIVRCSQFLWKRQIGISKSNLTMTWQSAVVFHVIATAHFTLEKLEKGYLSWKYLGNIL